MKFKKDDLYRKSSGSPALQRPFARNRVAIATGRCEVGLPELRHRNPADLFCEQLTAVGKIAKLFGESKVVKPVFRDEEFS